MMTVCTWNTYYQLGGNKLDEVSIHPPFDIKLKTGLIVFSHHFFLTFSFVQKKMKTETPPPEVVLTKRVFLPKSNAEAIIVSINRPSQLNCFNTEVVCTLAKIFSDIANNDDVAAVIFTGNGKTFCAGADLSNPPNPLEQSSDLPDHLLNNPVYQMSRIKVPIIGALKGYVITGGFELALACDILVGDETTKFRDTHCKFGMFLSFFLIFSFFFFPMTDTLTRIY